MAGEEKQLTEGERLPIPLQWWERALAAVVGAGTLGCGIIAVLVMGKDGAGSLALIAVGALFLLVGVAEVIPSAFKLGSNEMSVRRTAAEGYALRRSKEAQERLAEGDAAGAMHVLESVANPPAPELTLTPRVQDLASLRNDVLEYLDRWARKWAAAGYYINHPSPYYVRVGGSDKQVMVDLEGLAFGPSAESTIGAQLPNRPEALSGIVLVLRGDTWDYSEAIPAVERRLHLTYNVPVRSVLWGARDRYALLEMALRSFLGIGLTQDPATDAGSGQAK